MSPVTPTPGLNLSATTAPKGPVGLSAGAISQPASTAGAKTMSGATGDCQMTAQTGVPSLNHGKLIPGPDEWRALERRASSFRA